MFCSKCGQQVPDGSVFCSHCGNTLTDVSQPPANHEIPPQTPNMPPQGGWVPQEPGYSAPPGYPPQNHYAPQVPPTGVYPGYQAPPKKKKGLLIGLIVGIVVLLGIVAVLLFVWPGWLTSGQPVAGTWVSEDRGEAIEFSSGGSFDAYAYYGEYSGDYDYDKAKGEGHIVMSDEQEFDFVVDKDVVYVYDMGTFSKADDDFDLDEFIADATEEFGTAAGDES